MNSSIATFVGEGYISSPLTPGTFHPGNLVAPYPIASPGWYRTGFTYISYDGTGAFFRRLVIFADRDGKLDFSLEGATALAERVRPFLTVTGPAWNLRFALLPESSDRIETDIILGVDFLSPRGTALLYAVTLNGQESPVF